MSGNKSGSARWDERYAQEEFVYGKEANFFLQQKYEILKPAKTLCLAEGEGRNAVFLAERGHSVTAWDYSQTGLEKCRKLAAEKEYPSLPNWLISLVPTGIPGNGITSLLFSPIFTGRTGKECLPV